MDFEKWLDFKNHPSYRTRTKIKVLVRINMYKGLQRIQPVKMRLSDFSAAKH